MTYEKLFLNIGEEKSYNFKFMKKELIR
ncbi:hypothetical protein FORC67_0463 [Listeria monocytogenes]|nr:hypothetical protein FORC67_0463 [Listeria monocytogenes]